MSPASSVHLEQFKEDNNWDKGQERLLSVSSDHGYFGNKTSNASEQSEGVKKRAVSMNNVEHLYIRRTIEL